MRAWGVAALVCGLLTGCAGTAQQEKVDELTKKVATLEKRVKALESGKGKKAPKGKAPAKGKSKAAPKGAKGKTATGPATEVKASGDAKKVLLTDGKRKFPVPGKVPAGEYSILASFEETAQPAQSGTLTVTDQPVTIQCVAADKACKAD